jgi:hypothetical protein
VNFTREPIIETIISPKEGYKIVVRNSKAEGREEYVVEAVEVVSFGSTFFYRSIEKSKGFLVPVTDYEIIETKEVRMALKNVPIERAIKIGAKKEQKREEAPAVEEEVAAPAVPEQEVAETRGEKRRDRRKSKRRRAAEAREKATEEKAPALPPKLDEQVISSSMIGTLIPPPPNLISETLSRYKAYTIPPSDLIPEPVKIEEESQLAFEPIEEETPKERFDEEEGGEPRTLSRSMSYEVRSFEISLPSSLVNESNFLN